MAMWPFQHGMAMPAGGYPYPPSPASPYPGHFPPSPATPGHAMAAPPAPAAEDPTAKMREEFRRQMEQQQQQQQLERDHNAKEREALQKQIDSIPKPLTPREKFERWGKSNGVVPENLDDWSSFKDSHQPLLLAAWKRTKGILPPDPVADKALGIYVAPAAAAHAPGPDAAAAAPIAAPPPAGAAGPVPDPIPAAFPPAPPGGVVLPPHPPVPGAAGGAGMVVPPAPAAAPKAPPVMDPALRAALQKAGVPVPPAVLVADPAALALGHPFVPPGGGAIGAGPGGPPGGVPRRRITKPPPQIPPAGMAAAPAGIADPRFAAGNPAGLGLPAAAAPHPGSPFAGLLAAFGAGGTDPAVQANLARLIAATKAGAPPPGAPAPPVKRPRLDPKAAAAAAAAAHVPPTVRLPNVITQAQLSALKAMVPNLKGRNLNRQKVLDSLRDAMEEMAESTKSLAKKWGFPNARTKRQLATSLFDSIAP